MKFLLVAALAALTTASAVDKVIQETHNCIFNSGCWEKTLKAKSCAATNVTCACAGDSDDIGKVRAGVAACVKPTCGKLKSYSSLAWEFNIGTLCTGEDPTQEQLDNAAQIIKDKMASPQEKPTPGGNGGDIDVGGILDGSGIDIGDIMNGGNGNPSGGNGAITIPGMTGKTSDGAVVAVSMSALAALSLASFALL